jgi:hypothetical protein
MYVLAVDDSADVDYLMQSYSNLHGTLYYMYMYVPATAVHCSQVRCHLSTCTQAPCHPIIHSTKPTIGVANCSADMPCPFCSSIHVAVSPKHDPLQIHAAVLWHSSTSLHYTVARTFRHGDSRSVCVAASMDR